MAEPPKVGEWTRISQLGQGGFGVVTLWKNIETNEFIAVKKCKWTDTSKLTARQKERWESEVNMMKTIKNNNIVRFLPLPTKLDIALSRTNSSKLPILSMEYCSMGNLRHVLLQPDNMCGLKEDETKNIALDMANAVSYLHSLNITHRDIKPENVVLQKCDTRPTKVIYKLIDLGYAKELDSECASFVGTLQYLAPEILLAKQYDSTVDLWSLGIVIFEVIAGLHPLLPFLPLPTRIKHIQSKGLKNIYIYSDEHGSIQYSPEIPKETYVNYCLKLYVENWLRKVLQFDPMHRIATNIFDELKLIFKKKYIQVFCVYTYKFYYYEIDEKTLLIELQDWLEKDTEIPKSQQLVLTNYVYLNRDDNRKVIDCINNNACYIVLFKLKKTIDKTVSYEMPKLIQDLFINFKQYKWNELKVIISQAIFFVNAEKQLFKFLLVAFTMLIKYTNNLTHKASNQVEYAKNLAFKLTIEISCYNSLLENVDVKNGFNLVENLKKYEDTLSDANAAIEHLNNLVKKQSKLVNQKKIFDSRNLDDLKLNNLLKLYDNAVQFAKCGKVEGQETYSSIDIVSIVEETLKARYSMMKNVHEKQYSYFKCAWEICKRSTKYISHAHNLQNCISAISKKLLQLQQEKYSIMINSNHVKNTPETQLLSIDEINTDDILDSNTTLRYSLQEEISKSSLLYWTNLSSIEDMSID